MAAKAKTGPAETEPKASGKADPVVLFENAVRSLRELGDFFDAHPIDCRNAGEIDNTIKRVQNLYSTGMARVRVWEEREAQAKWLAEQEANN